MELLHKDYIEVLDYIVKTCFENRKITIDALVLPKTTKTKPEHYPNDEWEHRQKNEYYIIYIEILKSYSIVEITKIAAGYYIEAINPNTERFIKSGGFKKMYELQLENEIYERKIKKGNLASATNSIWTKKTYWFTFGIAIAGFVIACFALYYSVKK